MFKIKLKHLTLDLLLIHITIYASNFQFLIRSKVVLTYFIILSIGFLEGDENLVVILLFYTLVLISSCN